MKKKLFFTIALIAFAAHKIVAQPYVPRYDRGYEGNDYSARKDFLEGKTPIESKIFYH